METFVFRIYDKPLPHVELERKRWDPRLKLEQNLFFQLELSREELARLLPKLRGRPTFYEHMDNHPDYEPLPIMRQYGIKRESWGYIVRAEQDASSGSVYVFVRAFDTLGGASMGSKLKQRSGIKGCSLQHTRDMIRNKVWANEVSSCQEGKRPKTFYLGTALLSWSEDVSPAPVPTDSSEVLSVSSQADLNDLPYVLKKDPAFSNLLPAGMAFRGLEDFYPSRPKGESSTQWASSAHRQRLPGTGHKTDTHPLQVFCRASRRRPSAPGGGRPASPPPPLVSPSNPFFEQQIRFLLSSPFTSLPASKTSMSLNAKASLRAPVQHSPATTQTASVLAVKASDPDSSAPAAPNAGEGAAVVMSGDPGQEAFAPPSATEPVQPPPQAAPAEPAASEPHTAAPVPSQEAEGEMLEEGKVSRASSNVLEDLGAGAWESLNPEQRSKVQELLNALQSRHVQASHELRKELASKDQELKKWRSQKAAQEKKTLDDFMGTVLKVVSQTTGPETQACLQQALEDLNQRPEATIAEKASAFLPFVAQAQIMTAKNSANPSKAVHFSSQAPTHKQRASAKTPAPRRPVGLDITANRSLNTHKVGAKASRSNFSTAAPPAMKKKKLNSGDEQSSLGFVFSSALQEPSSNHRSGKFVFD